MTAEKIPFEQWHIPLSSGSRTLDDAYRSLRDVGLRQEQIPFMVQLVENPRYDVPGVEMFRGATDLESHDHIHILLGRGLLAKDEAFVLGFTMGSTNRMSATEERLYEFFTRYLYPKSYRFGDEEVQVFRDAVRLGYISDCVSLAEVKYAELAGMTLDQTRAKLGIEPDLLQAYFRIERRRYPDAVDSQRLLD
jgi:hypothetical protein